MVKLWIRYVNWMWISWCIFRTSTLFESFLIHLKFETAYTCCSITYCVFFVVKLTPAVPLLIVCFCCYAYTCCSITYCVFFVVVLTPAVPLLIVYFLLLYLHLQFHYLLCIFCCCTYTCCSINYCVFFVVKLTPAVPLLIVCFFVVVYVVIMGVARKKQCASKSRRAERGEKFLGPFYAEKCFFFGFRS